MSRRVTLVELSVYDNTVPLVSGYLQAYATQDASIAEAFEFDIYTRGMRGDPDAILGDLLDRRSDVYAFSCYIWNAGLVRRLTEALYRARPGAYFMLGGPQVMNHAARYTPAGAPNVVVCNGEGEQPFYEFLHQLLREAPDFGQVSGVSYWTGDGSLATVESPARLRRLDTVPSPFAAGLFDGADYSFTVLETNRGCPFHCGFCFWGAATNSKVYKFDEDRVRADIRWIAEHGVASVFIADANWGLSPRDVELSQHVVACKREFGFPTSMVIAAAKNRPERVAEITAILVAGGLVTSQPISLQTVNPDALRLVERENIRENTFTDLLRTLRERRISSFIELIWPLPGETLESFRAGVARLCRLGADTLTVYPQLLLHNTSLHERRELLGIETVRAPDAVAEADVVVATRWVNRAECERGTWFYYAVHALYNARGAYHLARYLDRSGLERYEDFFAAAATYFRARTDAGLCRFFADSVATADNYDLLNIGKATDLALRAYRSELDELLLDFARTAPWWSDPLARCALDVDLLSRPYVYSEPVRAPAVELSELRLVEVGDRAFVADLPHALAGPVARAGLLPPEVATAGAVQITHPRQGKMPHVRWRSLEQNAAYCHVMIQRLRILLPTVTPIHLTASSGPR